MRCAAAAAAATAADGDECHLLTSQTHSSSGVELWTHSARFQPKRWPDASSKNKRENAYYVLLMDNLLNNSKLINSKRQYCNSHLWTSSRGMISDRAVGALLGQAVGDALGFRYQYRSGEDVTNQICMDKDNSGFLPIRGSAVFDFPPGQLSDGTELCMLMARSLCRNGKISISDIIRNLLKWVDSDPLYMDETVLGVLSLDIDSESVKRLTPEELENVVVSSAFAHNVCNTSNKSLFMAVPIALISLHNHYKNDVIDKLCKRLIRLIQPNSIAADALIVLSITIRSLINTSSMHIPNVVDIAYNSSRNTIIKRHIALSKHRPHPLLEPDHYDNTTLSQEFRIDYLGVALQCAFYQLRYAKTFCDGVICALHLGGDTIANAAITAALLGARFGSNSIPEQWKETVTSAVLDRHEAFPDVCLSDVNLLVDQLINKVNL